jgi:hypothetical protein
MLAENHGMVPNQYSLPWIVILALVFITWFRGAWIEKRNAKGNAGSDNDRNAPPDLFGRPHR